MKDGAVGCFVITLIVIGILALSIFGLIWGGVLKVGNTIIDRQVAIHSQQYVTTHNEEIAKYIIDYNNVSNSDPTAAARRKSIVDSICLEVNQLDPTFHEIDPSNSVFASQHCAGY